MEVEEETIKGLTTKEIKALARPEFRANPEKFYPVETLMRLGFERTNCPKCKDFFWRCDSTKTMCGDSNCIGRYEFIGTGIGIGQEKEVTYADAWQTYKKSFSNARIPCTPIDRYPVVARWRADVEYVAAGIYCFQPYCVTGELQPPANPLIQPQFAVRFNDLDNIGLTGRHYSGFIMLGLQVFNHPNDYKFFKEECVEFHYNWLTQELKIPKEEILFREDVWAGGGNMGPCIEFFIKGMEIGNMVFMQYKTFHDGSREELPIKVIDVGIGLERIPWLLNGTATSYVETFKHGFNYLCEKLALSPDTKVWKQFGPYSSQLDVDESPNIIKTWQDIAQSLDMSVADIKKEIQPIKDMYIILDHMRTFFMIVYDGSLPSNVGGGGNTRNIIRRVFATIKNNNWNDKIGVEELMQVIECHCKDLFNIYGQFNDFSNIKHILENEYNKWLNTDKTTSEQLRKYIKKNQADAKKKNSEDWLSLDDWSKLMDTYGCTPEQIAQETKLNIPDNLYSYIAAKKETVVKPVAQILYDTSSLPETVCTYYEEHDKELTSKGKLVAIYTNVVNPYKGLRNIAILDRTSFYPTSGGQANDTGRMFINGETYSVVECEKVGKCVLHILDREISHNVGSDVFCEVDEQRRNQLMTNHTGTHIVFASCRKIIGPHVWQNGAKKTIEKAHLDITHYKPLSDEEVEAIENEANRIIQNGIIINKAYFSKDEAEKKHGFSLYQGGVVPGNSLRVVNITDTDVEACCGTHCDNTAEVEFVKILKTSKISDSVVRLEYVTSKKALEILIETDKVANQIASLWKVENKNLFKQAEKFLNDFKRNLNKTKKMEEKLVKFYMKEILQGSENVYQVIVENDNLNSFFVLMNEYIDDLVKNKKGLFFIGNDFVFSFLSHESLIDFEEFQKFLLSNGCTEKDLDFKRNVGKGKTKYEGSIQMRINHTIEDTNKILTFLKKLNVTPIPI